MAKARAGARESIVKIGGTRSYDSREKKGRGGGGGGGGLGVTQGQGWSKREHCQDGRG